MIINTMYLLFVYFLFISVKIKRFGTALVRNGQLSLRQRQFASDFGPLEPDCSCYTCRSFTRAYLHSIVGREALACQLLSIHNVAFQVFSIYRNSVLFDFDLLPLECVEKFAHCLLYMRMSVCVCFCLCLHVQKCE